MKILFLSPYAPYPPRSGGALRIYHLMRGLTPQHHVTCLTFVSDVQTEAALAPLREWCHVETVLGPPLRRLSQRALTTFTSRRPDMAFRNESPAYAAHLRRLLSSERFDVIQAASIEMAHYGLQVKAWTSSPHPLLVLDEFNAEYLLQRRAALNDLRRVSAYPRALIGGGYSVVQWLKLAAYERRMLRSYDRVLAVSADDRHALQRLQPSVDPIIVPNGVDSGYFCPQDLPRSADIVFTGTLDYRPNIDAITWFAHEVLPLIRSKHPQSRLNIVGRSPAPAVQALHNGNSINVIGEVPDVRPHIAAAGVYVVPMRIGGGVRLKLLEALSMGIPVVSTAMGAEGVEELRADQHILLADQREAFADAVNRVLSDPQRSAAMGVAGRALVTARYDWSAIAPKLEAAYAR